VVVRVRIGDKVLVDGREGFVEDVVRWIDRIRGMRDYEAKAFTGQCRMQCGPDYREKWGVVLVNFGKTRKRVPIQRVKILEGRDDKSPAVGFGSTTSMRRSEKA